MKIALIGSTGKMGGELRALMKSKSWAKLVRDPKEADLIVDFSVPAACIAAAKLAASLKIPMVSGTTGLSSDQFKTLKTLSKKTPILWAANMSWGVLVLRQMLKTFSAFKDYQVTIEEAHHKHKKDRPSGTALVLQADLQKVMKRKIPKPSSIRKDEIIGRHTIIAKSKNEQVVIEHKAFSRKTFAEGALIAAKWLRARRPGFYSLEDVYDDT